MRQQLEFRKQVVGEGTVNSTVKKFSFRERVRVKQSFGAIWRNAVFTYLVANATMQNVLWGLENFMRYSPEK
jgi:hypothetical protein